MQTCICARAINPNFARLVAANIDKTAVLLTGTVIPNSIHTRHADPAVRLAEYADAIGFYLEELGHDVYFLENSEADLNASADFSSLLSHPRLHVMRFPRSEKFGQGKGYQEFEMIDGAVAALQSSYSCFIKITGRYRIPNVKRITDVECPGLVIDLHRKSHYARTYLIIFRTDFYLKHFTGVFRQVNDSNGVYIEHVFYRTIREKRLLRYCRPFVRTPLLQGITGSYGITMRRNPFRVALRNIERAVMSVLGIRTFFY